MSLKFWKNKYFKLGMILGLFLVSLLVVLPKIPVNVQNEYVNIDTSVGGYYLAFSNGQKILDLRDFKKGLDLEGGLKIVLKVDMSSVAEENKESVLQEARSVIERRVNLIGIREPYIVTSRAGTDYKITVEVPGTVSVNEAVDLIGKTAKLEFMQLKEEFEWDEAKRRDYFLDKNVWEPTGVTGADIRNAEVVFSDTEQTQPGVQVNFSNEGRTKFEELAKNNIGKPIALYFDNSEVPIFMPIVSEEFAEGLSVDPTITGNFSIEEATSLTIQIKAGALPVPVEVLEQETIEPRLGFDTVEKSLYAGLLGILLIFSYMIVMYGRLGLVADLSLMLFGLLVLSLVKVIPVELTLPGITGFLLAFGLAVDSNILIFERIKEEVKMGRPKSLAIQFGFERAWKAIRDANGSTLLIAIILFYLGNGPVRGFAVMLVLGLVVSFFIVILVTHTLIEIFGLNKESRREKLVKFIFRKKNEAAEI